MPVLLRGPTNALGMRDAGLTDRIGDGVFDIADVREFTAEHGILLTLELEARLH